MHWSWYGSPVFTSHGWDNQPATTRRAIWSDRSSYSHKSLYTWYTNKERVGCYFDITPIVTVISIISCLPINRTKYRTNAIQPDGRITFLSFSWYEYIITQLPIRTTLCFVFEWDVIPTTTVGWCTASSNQQCREDGNQDEGNMHRNGKWNVTSGVKKVPVIPAMSLDIGQTVIVKVWYFSKI